MNGEFIIAVHALVFLNFHHGDLFSSETLAQNVCTNPARIRKVMARLKRAGLVETKAGAEGGYLFCKDAGSVTLRTICEAVGARIVAPGWHSGRHDLPCLIASGMSAVMEELAETLDASARAQLSQTTLADITARLFAGR